MRDGAASGEVAGGSSASRLAAAADAAQGGSRLLQQPCKHPGQPAASQLVLEISLGKCSQLRGFYSSE